jgi:hypothetical protein
MLSDEERALAEALQQVERTVPERASSSAVGEVTALLRRLGSQVCTPGEPPSDEASAPRDDRLQQQRPG